MDPGEVDISGSCNNDEPLSRGFRGHGTCLHELCDELHGVSGWGTDESIDEPSVGLEFRRELLQGVISHLTEGVRELDELIVQCFDIGRLLSGQLLEESPRASFSLAVLDFSVMGGVELQGFNFTFGITQLVHGGVGSAALEFESLVDFGGGAFLLAAERFHDVTFVTLNAVEDRVLDGLTTFLSSVDQGGRFRHVAGKGEDIDNLLFVIATAFRQSLLLDDPDLSAPVLGCTIDGAAFSVDVFLQTKNCWSTSTQRIISIYL